MIEVGRLVLKIAGRDAGKKGLVVDVLDSKNVLIDGEVRRRKCNVAHIEMLDKVLKIEKNASHDKVKAELKKIGVEVKDRKAKEKKEKPKKVRKKKKKVVVEEKGKKKKEKKEKKKVKEAKTEKKEEVKSEQTK